MPPLNTAGKIPLGAMSPVQQKGFLASKGFNRALLNQPGGLASARRAYNQGMDGYSWGIQFSGTGAAMGPGGRSFDIVNVQRAPGGRGGRGTGRGGGGGGGGGQGGIPSVNDIFGQLQDMIASAQGPQPTLNLPKAPNYNKMLKGLKAPIMKPKQIKKMIKAQYKPIIENLEMNLKQLGLQSEQNLADVKSWYGQVAEAAEQGRARDVASVAAAKGSLGAAITAFTAAVGGSASPAAADIAKSGLSAQGGLAAIGLAQEQFDNNLGALIGQAQADAMRAEKNRASFAALEVMKQIHEAKGQQAADIINAVFQAKQQNFSNKMQLAQFKISVKEQAFQNALQIAQLQYEAQANQAAAADPVQLLMSAIQIQNGLIENARAKNMSKADALDYANAQLGYQQSQVNLARSKVALEQDIRDYNQAGQPKPLTASESNTLINTIADNLLEETPEGGMVPAYGGDRKTILRAINTQLNARGINPKSAQGIRMRNAILERLSINPYSGFGGSLQIVPDLASLFLG